RRRASERRVDRLAVRDLALADAAARHAVLGIGEREATAHGVALIAEQRRDHLAVVVAHEARVVAAAPVAPERLPRTPAAPAGSERVGGRLGGDLHVAAGEVLAGG